MLQAVGDLQASAFAQAVRYVQVLQQDDDRSFLEACGGVPKQTPVKRAERLAIIPLGLSRLTHSAKSSDLYTSSRHTDHYDQEACPRSVIALEVAGEACR